jgi:hypothetical protein
LRHSLCRTAPAERSRTDITCAPASTTTNSAEGAPDRGEYRQAARVAEKDLKVHAEYRKYALHYCGKAEQGHENFEQISKSPITHKSIDEVKANCADNDDDQYVY